MVVKKGTFNKEFQTIQDNLGGRSIDFGSDGSGNDMLNGSPRVHRTSAR